MNYKTIMKNLDKLRPDKHSGKITKEQRALLVKARENDKPVSYVILTKIWKDLGWGKISTECLRRTYQRIKENKL